MLKPKYLILRSSSKNELGEVLRQRMVSYGIRTSPFLLRQIHEKSNRANGLEER